MFSSIADIFQVHHHIPVDFFHNLNQMKCLTSTSSMMMCRRTWLILIVSNGHDDFSLKVLVFTVASSCMKYIEQYVL